MTTVTMTTDEPSPRNPITCSNSTTSERWVGGRGIEGALGIPGCMVLCVARGLEPFGVWSHVGYRVLRIWTAWGLRYHWVWNSVRLRAVQGLWSPSVLGYVGYRSIWDLGVFRGPWPLGVRDHTMCGASGVPSCVGPGTT